jgi:hypothetical protein
MRSLLLAALIPALLSAAPALQIVKPIISQSDGGEPDAPGVEHVAGETLYFTCRVDGFTKDPTNKVRVAYSVQAFDPRGAALDEIYKNEVFDEVLPQDKDWQPKIETELAIPPLAPAGEYKIVVKAEDLLAKTSTETSVAFRIRGTKMEPASALVIRNFGFYRGEDEAQAMAKPLYHNGNEMWARFDITGYKYGPNNKVDVSYVVSILGGERVLKTFDPAAEQSESFYPKPWIPASLGVPLNKVQAGEYILVIRVKDAVGNQTAETRRTFTVE